MDMQQERLFTPRQLRLLVLPLIVELALKLVVGMVDSVMVASAGEAAVSGVSLVDTVMQLVIYVFAAMASGGAVVARRNDLVVFHDDGAIDPPQAGSPLQDGLGNIQIIVFLADAIHRQPSRRILKI